MLFLKRVFDNVWSFILTLVRSLLTLFSFRRRSSDPFPFPTINPTKRDLARTHARLRPILLTPRTIALSAAHRALSTRTRSATSTLFPARDDCPTGPERTSPKLDPQDPELGLSTPAADPPSGPSGSATTSTTSSGEAAHDTSVLTAQTGSLSVVPLTPLDRCYLAPVSSSVTDCPYTEPWPANVPRDRLNKSKIPGSPLRTSMYQFADLAVFAQPMVRPVGSPPPASWHSVPQIWTSTPCKNDKHAPPGPAVSPFDNRRIDIEVSKALISRSRYSLQPYDDVSNSSTSSESDVSLPFVSANDTDAARPTRATRLSRSHPQFQSYPSFYHLHGARLPGKPNRHSVAHGAARSLAKVPFATVGWHDPDAFEFSPSSSPSPVSPLSPSNRSETSTNEDSVPLGLIRERLTSWSHAEGKEWEQQYNWLNANLPPLWLSAGQRDSKAPVPVTG